MKALLTDANTILFWCPGCESYHGVPVPPADNAWNWNGSLEQPTLSPSIRVGYGGAPDKPKQCHLFVKDGFLQFCPDSDHKLAGKTVEMREEEI